MEGVGWTEHFQEGCRYLGFARDDKGEWVFPVGIGLKVSPFDIAEGTSGSVPIAKKGLN
jgi:hypothetical protein